MHVSERWLRCGRNRLPSFASKMKLMNAEDCNKRVHFESPVLFWRGFSIVFITRGLWRWFLSCVCCTGAESRRRRRVNALLFKEEGSLVRVFFLSLSLSLTCFALSPPSSSRGKSVRPPEVASSLAHLSSQCSVHHNTCGVEAIFVAVERARGGRKAPLYEPRTVAANAEARRVHRLPPSGRGENR